MIRSARHILLRIVWVAGSVGVAIVLLMFAWFHTAERLASNAGREPLANAETALPEAERIRRGEYLSHGAHCGACHTPRGLGHQERTYDESSRDFLLGEVNDDRYAPSLRNSLGSAIGRPSTDERVSGKDAGMTSHCSRTHRPHPGKCCVDGTDAGVDAEERGRESSSDHAPVWAELSLGSCRGKRPR
jgi:hypothetical protein